MTLANIIAMVELSNITEGIISTLIYTAIGIVVAVLAYFIVDMIIPGNMGKQIAEEKNVPIAIVAGSMILGICLIIAASIL